REHFVLGENEEHSPHALEKPRASIFEARCARVTRRRSCCSRGPARRQRRGEEVGMQHIEQRKGTWVASATFWAAIFAATSAFGDGTTTTGPVAADREPDAAASDVRAAAHAMGVPESGTNAAVSPGAKATTEPLPSFQDAPG